MTFTSDALPVDAIRSNCLFDPAAFDIILLMMIQRSTSSIHIPRSPLPMTLPTRETFEILPGVVLPKEETFTPLELVEAPAPMILLPITVLLLLAAAADAPSVAEFETV